MACYHFNMSIISRGKGQSIVAADAYISGEKLRDIYDGKLHDRSYRRDVVYREIQLPPQAPREFMDRQTWVDAINLSERRCDAQMARSIKMALPNELALENQIALVKEFVSENFTKYGLCADIAIHRGTLDPNRKPAGIEAVQERRDNPHAHIILPFRVVDVNGFQRTKTQGRFMNHPSFLNRLREEWARLQNREFERLGLEVRVSHERLEVQGIRREPTKHIGAAAMALEQKGIRTERGEQYREIIAQNRDREVERPMRAKRRDRDREVERPMRAKRRDREREIERPMRAQRREREREIERTR